MWDFDHPDAEGNHLRREFEVSYTVPSACAEMLRTGQADIGIIPAITYQTIPDLVVIPEVCIASNGPVRSILLVSQVPLGKIKTVSVDTSSRTSVALLEILFRKGWLFSNHKSQITNYELQIPRFLPTTPNLEKMLKTCDAALLIGDPALTVSHSKFAAVVDLGEAWTRHTGKPFVYAFWAVRKAALEDYVKTTDLASIFQQSRDHGLIHVDDIAREWSPRVAISESEVKSYLNKSIDYKLQTEELGGLKLFFQLASKSGIIAELRRFEQLSLVRHPPICPERCADAPSEGPHK